MAGFGKSGFSQRFVLAVYQRLLAFISGPGLNTLLISGCLRMELLREFVPGFCQSLEFLWSLLGKVLGLCAILRKII